MKKLIIIVYILLYTAGSAQISSGRSSDAYESLGGSKPMSMKNQWTLFFSLIVLGGAGYLIYRKNKK